MIYKLFTCFFTKPLGILLLFSLLLLSCTLKSDTEKTTLPTSEDHKRKLLVIENAFYTENGKLRSYRHLVSYNFEQGILLSKDTLTDKTVDLSGFNDYGNVCNSIYKNRYIISAVGGTLFDIKTKKILLNDVGSLVDSIGDSLIFHLQKFDIDAYYLYNLKTTEYAKLTSGSYINVEGKHSPDKKHGLKTYVDSREMYTTKNYQVILFDSINNKETIISTGGMATYLLSSSSEVAEIPVHWLDNAHFIYAKYLFPPINDLTSIEIHKVNIHSKSDEKVCAIDSVKKSFENGTFQKMPSGNIIFYDSNKAYELDKSLTHLSAKELISKSIGYDFEINYSPDFIKTSLLFKGESIKQDCPLYGFKITEGYIATDELSVWSTYTNKWTTIKSNWIVSNVGWIK